MRYPLNMLHLIVNFISRDKMSSDNPQIEKNKSDILLFLKLPSTRGSCLMVTLQVDRKDWDVLLNLKPRK